MGVCRLGGEVSLAKTGTEHCQGRVRQLYGGGKVVDWLFGQQKGEGMREMQKFGHTSFGVCC